MRLKELKRLREIEALINRNLYILCIALTIMTMGVILVEFFSRGKFANFDVNIFYLGVLLVYSLHKEIIRLMGRKNFQHHGEYFVYAWVVLTAALYLINFGSRNYYTSAVEFQPNTILSDTSVLTIEVMFVFIITRAFKIVRALFILEKN